MRKLKIALVHDYLCGIGGSERVFQHICEAFPKADIFTIAYNPKKTLPYYNTKIIKTSVMNLFIRNMSMFRLFFPINIFVMKLFNFSSYDLIISSSASTAKYLNKRSAKHICYCYIPTRAIWNTQAYFGNAGLKIKVFLLLINFFKKMDLKAAAQVDEFIAISKFTQEMIKKIYHKNSVVINSPIDTKNLKFLIKLNKKPIIRDDYYLLVSRLEKWKNVDSVIEAFNKNKKKLIIVGNGSEFSSLKRKSNKNILFKTDVNDKDLVNYYKYCRSVIFPTYLEYGLIPIEANLCGVLAICLDSPGVRETMIPYNGKSEKFTAIFYKENNIAMINDAVYLTEKITLNKKNLFQNAERFNENNFISKLKQFITNNEI
jgi:glycosyltransferase involved in cell wall biosynthesis